MIKCKQKLIQFIITIYPDISAHIHNQSNIDYTSTHCHLTLEILKEIYNFANILKSEFKAFEKV